MGNADLNRLIQANEMNHRIRGRFFYIFCRCPWSHDPSHWIALLSGVCEQVLDDFWGPFHSTVDGMTEVRITEVIDALDAELGMHFFSDNLDAGVDGEPLTAEVRQN